MKRTILILLILTISCTSESTEQGVLHEEQSEKVNYTFDGVTFSVLYNQDERQLIPIENEESKLLESIYLKNENLIQYMLDERNILLFATDDELNVYLKKNGKSLAKVKESLSSSSSSTFTEWNLELFYDCCYDQRGRFFWAVSPCFAFEFNSIQRLEDMADRDLWKIRPSPLACIGPNWPQSANPNWVPNDRMNSVKVRGVLARFYEDIDYGGRSIVLDGRNGETGFRKLRLVRAGGRWGNRISSIKLSF